MIRFEDLIEKVRASNPDADTELLRRAYVFSAYEHKGQVRGSGEPYMVHPLEVADLLADLHLDVAAIARVCCTTSSRHATGDKVGSCSASRWLIWSRG
jgi:GTP pyrophosphokinase